MVNRSVILAFLFLCIITEIVLSQQEEISSKKNELEFLKEEIRSLENELKQKDKNERESYSAVENLSRQNFLLNKLVNTLKSEERQKTNEIRKSERRVSLLEKEISALQENYAKYVVAVYKYGKVEEIDAFINARSVQQAIHRYKYFQKFSRQRAADLDKIKNQREQLLFAKKQLEEEKIIKANLAVQKEREEKELSSKLNEKKNILALVRKDKTEIKKEIDTKKAAEQRIRNLITKLIEDAERKKREEERLAAIEKEKAKQQTNIASTAPVPAENKVTAETENYYVDLSTANLASFSALKGRMNWPVAGGKVHRKFGENKNPQLNTVTMNHGIDIQVGSDLNVRSVADGIISAIDWIPGYGSVIIITHKEDFRTVYSHLSEIYVREGDRVKAGSVIAKVGESIDGNVLHFEIWSSRNNQNPEVWLARR
jgi:murein hydrolase activator